MGDKYLSDPEDEVAPLVWPENIGDKHNKQFKMENLENDHDALKDVNFDQTPVHADIHRLMEMANSEKGTSHMQYFVKHWEYKRANTVRLLNEELGLLSQQRKEIEEKKQQILEDQRCQDENYYAAIRQVPILDEVYKDEWKRPSKKGDDLSCNQELKIDAEYDSILYWKGRAMQLEKALEASLQRERALEEKLEQGITNLQSHEKLEQGIKNLQSHTPVEEFSGMLKRADYFLHLVLDSAPIVIAHQVCFVHIHTCSTCHVH
jgi:hypothetical protein